MRPPVPARRLLAAAAAGVLLVLSSAPGQAADDTTEHEHHAVPAPATTGGLAASDPAGPAPSATAIPGKTARPGQGVTAPDRSAGATDTDEPSGSHDLDDMAGMDHGESGATAHEDAGTTSGTPRPRVAALSSFGAVNLAVLAAAAWRRHHERLHPRHRPRRSPGPA